MINISGINGNLVTLTWDFGNNGDPFTISIEGQQVATSVIRQATITLDMTKQNQITISDENTGTAESLVFFPQAVTTGITINPWVLIGAAVIAGIFINFKTKRRKHG